MRDDLSVVDFKTWHLKLFEPGEFYHSAIKDPNVRAAHYDAVDGVTVLIGGEVAAIIGIVPIWEGVAEATLVPSPLMYRHPKTVLKVARNLIDVAFSAYKLRRLQAMCLASHEKHQRFLEALGFVKEAVLNSFTDSGQTVYVYAIVRTSDG